MVARWGHWEQNTADAGIDQLRESEDVRTSIKFVIL